MLVELQLSSFAALLYERKLGYEITARAAGEGGHMPVRKRGKSWQAAVSHKGVRHRRDFERRVDAELWAQCCKQKLLAGLEATEPRKLTILDWQQTKRRRKPTALEAPAPQTPATKPPSASNGNDRTLSELLDYVIAARWRGLKGEAILRINAEDVLRILGPSRQVSSLNKMDALTVKTIVLDRGRTPATVNRKLAALSVLVREAVELKWLNAGFKVGLMREPKGRVRFFSNEEEAAMLEWTDRWEYHDLRDYIIVSIDTGLRQGEILKVLKRDVKDRIVWTYDTKNGNNRDVPLTERARQVLDRRAGRIWLLNDPLFDIRAATLRSQWKLMQQHLGMLGDKDYLPHALRHTFVTRLIERGVDIRTVQELAGHNLVQTTQRYAHTSPERKVRAIERLEPSQ